MNSMSRLTDNNDSANASHAASAPSDAHVSLQRLIQLQFDARHFSLTTKQPIHSLLSGQHASRLRGLGMIFEELRDYRPGDDIRSIDWRATARLRRACTRVYNEERDRPVLLLVDQRVNMFFGSIRTTKATAAAELAALAAWRTLRMGDRVGALIFGDQEIVELKPQRSRTNVMRLCHQLVRINHGLSTQTSSRPGMLNEALTRAVNLTSHDYLIVLITDYNGDDNQTTQLVSQLAAKNDVLAALVYDPLGISINNRLPLDATDGEQQVSIPVDERLSQQFQQAFIDRCETLQQRLRSIRIPILPIGTQHAVIDQLREALGAGG